MQTANKKRKRVDSPRVDRISPDAARERLALVAQFLTDEAGPFDDAAKEAACAFREFLEGRAPSLDAAFGLVRPRGAPKTQDAKHLAHAEVVLKHLKGLNRGGWSIDWDAALSELQKKGGITDERALRRIWKTHGAAAFSKILGKVSGS